MLDVIWNNYKKESFPFGWIERQKTKDRSEKYIFRFNYALQIIITIISIKLDISQCSKVKNYAALFVYNLNNGSVWLEYGSSSPVQISVQ